MDEVRGAVSERRRGSSPGPALRAGPHRSNGAPRGECLTGEECARGSRCLDRNCVPLAKKTAPWVYGVSIGVVVTVIGSVFLFYSLSKRGKF